MNTHCTIRPYVDSDLDSIKQLTIEAFQGVSIDQNIENRFGTVRGNDWKWRKARHIDQDVRADGSAIAVAENARGEIVGYITTRLDHAAGVGFIPNISVASQVRGQGIGRRLIEHALEQFRAAGLEIARIETLDQNEIGSHLYPSCGFEEVARQVHYAMRLNQDED